MYVFCRSGMARSPCYTLPYHDSSEQIQVEALASAEFVAYRLYSLADARFVLVPLRIYTLLLFGKIDYFHNPLGPFDFVHKRDSQKTRVCLISSGVVKRNSGFVR
jgi:hypothetical protein